MTSAASTYEKKEDLEKQIAVLKSKISDPRTRPFQKPELAARLRVLVKKYVRQCERWNPRRLGGRGKKWRAPAAVNEMRS